MTTSTAYRLDSRRIQLQNELTLLLKSEKAEPDIIKQSQTLFSKYPNLAALKERIKYPEDIAKVNVKDFTYLVNDLEKESKITHQIGKEFLQLADYYRSFKNKLDTSTEDIRATLLSSKVKVEGDLIEPHLITQETARKLLSRNKFGDVIKLNFSGNHPVVAINGLHLKSATDHEPLDTGMEIGVYLLHTFLFGEEIGPGLAPSSLLTFDDVEIEEPTNSFIGRDKDRFEEASGSNRRSSFFRRHPRIPLATKPHTYVLQASKSIEGKPLDDVLDESLPFDEENFSSLILASFLTVPSDNKPDNFIVTMNQGQLVARITGIDNDMAFAFPLTTYGDKKEHMIGLKNALFCFDKMMDKSIAPRVRVRIAQLDPILLSLEWAAALIQQEQRFPSQKINQAKLPLLFTKYTLHNLIANLQTLQKILANTDLKSVTHRQIFRLLFPVVERYYQGLSLGTKSTSEKVENLFSPKLPSVESYLNQRDRLEDGRTIQDALQSSDKRTFAYQEERNTSIEAMCYDVFSSLDLSLLPPLKQCAILSLAVRHFPNLANKELHSSWKKNTLLFVLANEEADANVFQFLEKLGVNLSAKNEDGNTVIHLLARKGQNLPKVLLQQQSLETRNNKALTPLDIAMDQKHIGVFIALLDAGAGTTASSSRAWEFYNEVVLVKNDPILANAFQRFITKNMGISWKMAREKIFPKNGSIPVVSALYGKKSLHPDAVKQLWDGTTFKAVNATGKRAVGQVTVDGYTLYFKQAPELPGVEQAVGTLMHQVMGFGAPHTDLIMMNGTPYLVSQGIPGATLQHTLENNPDYLKQLNRQRLSQQILMAMITNPEDGKPDNLVLEPIKDGFQLVSVDNDHAFVPSVAKEKLFGDKRNKVQVKTILYCLDQMNEPIDPIVREQFLKHDPALILIDWLTHLSSVDGLYNEIFKPDEKKRIFDNLGTFVGIPFRVEMISELYRKMVKIQFILEKEKNNPNFSHIDLLTQLDAALGQRYSVGLKMKSTPMQRFLAVDGKDYEIDKKGAFVSTRQAKEILQSYDIKTQTDMKALIQAGTALNAEEALRVLQKVVNKDQLDLTQRLLLAEGTNLDFNFLDVNQASEFLKKIDFSKLQFPVVQSILNQIKKFPWRELVLRNASTITNSYLKSLNFSQLTSLELRNCEGLTDQVVSQIVEQARELKKLDLSGNSSFESICEVRGIARERVPLDLNKITHLILNNCSKLHTLMVKGNQLAVIECEGNTLTNLNVVSTSLSNLNIKNNKQLTDIALDLTIAECPKIKRINIEGCNYITQHELRIQFPFYPLSFISTFAESRKQTIINLLENSINDLVLSLGVNELKALTQAIKCNTSLKRLRLIEGDIGPEGAKLIAESLRCNSSLTDLDIGDNMNDHESSQALTGTGIFIAPPNRKIGDEGAKAIAEGLKDNSFLTRLRLSHCDIRLEGAKSIAKMLKSNSTLKYLSLHYNNISDDGVKFIAEALKFNTTLEDLDFFALRPPGNPYWEGKLRAKGAKVLAQALSVNSSLMTLNLSSNEIGPEGAKAIADALKVNSSLKYLSIDNNSIQDEGVIDIAEALKKNSSLLFLFMREYKEVTIKGVQALVEALSLNTTLMDINPPYVDETTYRRTTDELFKIGFVNLQGDFTRDLRATATNLNAIKYHPSLTELDFSKIPVNNENIIQISELIATNNFIVSINYLNLKEGLNENTLLLLCNALKLNRSLKHIDLTIDSRFNKFMLLFCESLQNNKPFAQLTLTTSAHDLSLDDALKTQAITKLSLGKIDDKNAIGLAKAIKTNTSLKKIKLEAGKEGIKSIAEALSNHNSISELVISNGDDEGAKAIANTLRTNTSLKWLFMSGINDAGAKAIAEVLLVNTSLIELCLQWNMANEGAKAIAQTLKSRPSLKIQLYGYDEYKDLGLEGALALAEAARFNDSLIKMFRNGDNPFISAIASALKAKKTLSELIVYGVGPEKAKMIAKALISDTIIELNLNDIGNEGAIAIATALLTNTSVIKVELGHEIRNKIGHEGIKAFIEMLKSNTTIETFSFYHVLGTKERETLRQCGFQSRLNANEFRRESLQVGNSSPRSQLDSSVISTDNQLLIASSHSLSSSSSVSQIDCDDVSIPEITPGVLFTQGKVLETTDQHEAIGRYLEAALQKHDGALKRLEELSKSLHHAQYALGSYYEKENDLHEAAHYYARATVESHLQAKQALCRLAETDPNAQSQLAILMQKGLGVKENKEQALVLHKKAADQGNGLSLLHLGVLYYMGMSTKENKDLALFLITQAEGQGVPQASMIKAQIQKEILEKEKIIRRAATLDQALYVLANRKADTDLFQQLPQIDQSVFSSSQIKIKKAQQEAFEREEKDLIDQINAFEAQKQTARGVEHSLLTKKIEELRGKLTNLAAKQKVQANPAEEARQYFLNQKRELFYSGFKEKISTIFQAVDAILSGNASRNVSNSEQSITSAISNGVGWAIQAAASVIPFAGFAANVTSYAIEKYISYKKDEEVNKQCRKIQGFYPERGVLGVHKFASTLASGLAFRFQDHIPHLSGESIEKLINHCVLSFADYLYEKALDDASSYELLVGGIFHKPTTASLKDLFRKKHLITDYGLEWSIEDLFFSTGVQTIFGGKYLPKDLKRRAFINEIEKKAKEHKKDYPIYRWGTKEEIERLLNLGIEMECIEEERIGALATEVENSKATARYLLEAESLSSQFLEGSTRTS